MVAITKRLYESFLEHAPDTTDESFTSDATVPEGVSVSSDSDSDSESEPES